MNLSYVLWWLMTVKIIVGVTPSTRRALKKKNSQTWFLNWGIKTSSTRFYDPYGILIWISGPDLELTLSVIEVPLPSSCLSFLHFFPPCNIFLLLWLFLQLEVSIRKLKLSGSIAVVLQASQTAVFFYHLSSSIVSCTSGLLRLQFSSTIFQVQLLAVLPDFSGFNCLLPIVKFNCNCTSGLLRLQLSSTSFWISSSTVVFFSEFFCLSTFNYFA
jgi:hypothetical protein